VRYSPDGSWVSFNLPGPATSASYVAPVRGLKAAGEAEWVRVDDSDADSHGWWSADGNLLYFLSRREGPVCVYARRLDPTTKRPIGPAFDVYHVHRPGMAISVADFGRPVGTRLIFSMNSSSGSIWMGVPE
jgi:Tol biopolymer transport system component